MELHNTLTSGLDEDDVQILREALQSKDGQLIIRRIREVLAVKQQTSTSKLLSDAEMKEVGIDAWSHRVALLTGEAKAYRLIANILNLKMGENNV